jgi:putative Mg2+ transporter-C (MgtC) family protein
MDALLDALAQEFARSPGPTEAVIIVRIAGAAVFSAIIGIERELRSQAAGLRTNMMVGIASAVFGIVGITLIAEYEGRSDTIRIDPLRLIEAVTGGVAFLAAGLIVFTRGRVHGLTTGAGVWLAAAAGLATGLGQWFVAAAAAIGGIFVLALLRAVEKAVGLRKSSPDDEPGDD